MRVIVSIEDATAFAICETCLRQCYFAMLLVIELADIQPPQPFSLQNFVRQYVLYPPMSMRNCFEVQKRNI